jgi:hypothetical protein
MNGTPPKRGKSSRKFELISFQTCVGFVVVNLTLEQVQPRVGLFFFQYHYERTSYHCTGFNAILSELSMALLDKTPLDTSTQKLV